MSVFTRLWGPDQTERNWGGHVSVLFKSLAPPDLSHRLYSMALMGKRKDAGAGLYRYHVQDCWGEAGEETMAQG